MGEEEGETFWLSSSFLASMFLQPSLLSVPPSPSPTLPPPPHPPSSLPQLAGIGRGSQALMRHTSSVLIRQRRQTDGWPPSGESCMRCVCVCVCVCASSTTALALCVCVCVRGVCVCVCVRGVGVYVELLNHSMKWTSVSHPSFLTLSPSSPSLLPHPPSSLTFPPSHPHSPMVVECLAVV